MPRPSPKGPKPQVAAKVPQWVRDALQRRAEREDMTVSGLVERILINYFQAERPKTRKKAAQD
jgi:hypothetical protein